MIYLLTLYWIFAALFCFGAIFDMAEAEKRNIFVVFLGCLVMGGIFFPIYLGQKFKF